MTIENRRRAPDRRRSPGSLNDVMRIEHENLCSEVDELSRAVGRIESQLSRVQERVALLERRMELLP